MKSTVIQSKRRLSTLISDGESVDTKNKRKRIRNLVRVSLPNPRKIYFYLNLQLKAARTLGLLSIQIFLAWMPYLFLTIFKINQSETSKILSERLRIYLMAKNRQKFFMQLWETNYDKFLKGGAINMSFILGITKQCPKSNCLFNDKSRISQVCLSADLYRRRPEKSQRFYLRIKSCIYTDIRSGK